MECLMVSRSFKKMINTLDHGSTKAKKVKTIKMYFLLPLDILYRRKHSMKIMTLEETILYILEKECSVSRFGDGEFNLLSDTDSKIII